MFILEAGINHFGNLKEANKIDKFFLKSSFKNLTFMIHNEKFYNKYKLKGINFELPHDYYLNLISKCHKRNKKIGLSVCDPVSFNKYKSLNFDFYKLLSVGINDKKLIKMLISRKKPVYVSTGFKSTDSKIKQCFKFFKKYKKVSLLHTPMTYNVPELNFRRIFDLRKKFRCSVGYSNHNNDFNTLNFLATYNPSVIFIYCKPSRKKNRVYPDDKHALFLDELEKLKTNYINYKTLHLKKKIIGKVNIFSHEIKK